MLKFRVEPYGSEVAVELAKPLTKCPVCSGPLRYGKFSKPAGACYVTNAARGQMVCVGPKRAAAQRKGG